jgi:mono/diheme cytochrome c family protein
MLKRGLLLILLLSVSLWLALDGGDEKTELSRLAVAERATEQALEVPVSALPSHHIIDRGDLPPPGTRSLFDHHIAQLGALPYQFSALLDSFKPLDRWSSGSVSVLIPDGRSLSKGHADVLRPRVVSAVQLDSPWSEKTISPIYSGRMFFGFVEASNLIEVISYNEAAGRFEFQLVKDYCAGCAPRIVYTQRATCLACHQSAAPIFSARPWQESNAHSAIAKSLVETRGLPWPTDSAELYQGVPLSTQILMPETLDELTALASDLTLSQKVWLDGCGEDGMECRRQLLAQALSLFLEPGTFHPESAGNQRLFQLQQLSWPAQGIAVANDRIANRNPLTSISSKDLWLQRGRSLINQWWQKSNDISGNAGMRVAAFDRLPKLPVALDPLVLRTPVKVLSSDTLAGVHGIAALFHPNDRKLLLDWSGDDPRRLIQLILAGSIDALLSPVPVSRVAILQGIGAALGHEQLAYCCLDTTSFSPPQTEDVQALQITSGSVLEVFQTYCFACHRDNPINAFNFMGGGSEREVLATIKATRLIRDVLDYSRYDQAVGRDQLMPPLGSLQRSLLDQARAELSDDLQRMRDTVPAAVEL